MTKSYKAEIAESMSDSKLEYVEDLFRAENDAGDRRSLPQ